MATKKAAANKGTAKRTSKPKKGTADAASPSTQTNEATFVDLVESEADTTATTPTDKDLQEGAIADVVTETAETPIVNMGEKTDKDDVTVTKVYRAKVVHHHASGPKHPYSAIVKVVGGITGSIYSNDEKLAEFEKAAISAVNAEHNLGLEHGAYNVTVEPTLVDFYFVEG